MLRGEPTHPGGVPECAEAERVFIAPVVGWLVVSKVVRYQLVGGLKSGTLPTCWRSRDTTDQTALLWPQGPEVQHLSFFRISKKGWLLSPHMGHGGLAAEAKGKTEVPF